MISIYMFGKYPTIIVSWYINIFIWLSVYIAFGLAEWGEPHVVLHGHRSIVNQVRYNRYNNLIASSGVEKMVKVSFMFMYDCVHYSL